MVIYTSDPKLFTEPPDAETYISICEFLSLSFIKDFVLEIERKYYAEHHFHYNVGLMVKLVVIKCYRKVSFRKLMNSLSEEDLMWLFPQDELTTEYKLPNWKTVHYFVKYRLGEEGFNALQLSLGKEITRYLNTKFYDSECSNLIVDSTPLEASRYSTAKFNTHYNICMAKSHIVSLRGYPIYMIYTDGNTHDSPVCNRLISCIGCMHPKAKYFLADGGYDSREIYADIVQILGVTPAIVIRENGVIVEDSEETSLRKLANKLWKQGGNPKDSIENILKFLYNLKPINKKDPAHYKKLVGGYYRNQLLRNWPNIEQDLKKRGLCEQRHAQFKKVFKFDIKSYHDQSRELYVLTNFVSIQLMFLTYLQNGSLNTNLANFY